MLSDYISIVETEKQQTEPRIPNSKNEHYRSSSSCNLRKGVLYSSNGS